MTTKRRSAARLVTGPWKSVSDSPDPFDADPSQLLDAVNYYIPDPVNGSGIYQRPGFTVLNTGYLGVAPYRCSGVYTHTDADGTTYHFLAISGKMYRADSTLSIFTDVTPVGVTLDATAGNRIYFASMNGVMVVNDGVHRPWVASTLAATPIVGTYISYDGGATAWTAFGQPVVYGGAGFWILNTVSGTSARLTISWTEPGDWTTGYQQPGIDNNWTLEQTGTTPLYALAATNSALYYFREHSIGTIAGVVGPDLAANATHDAIAQNVGCTAPATVQQFGDNIFFCDALGRPYALSQGNAPREIWKQMRGVVDRSQVGFPAITAKTACAVIDPVLNKYIVGVWSYSPATTAPTTELYSFDARTGTYEGRWLIGAVAGAVTGIYVDALGTWTDEVGRSVVTAVGSSAAADFAPTYFSGWLWAMSGVGQVGQPLGTETTSGGFPVDMLGTEDGRALATEGTAVTFLENGLNMRPYIQTQPLGYEMDAMLLVDQIKVMTGDNGILTITDTNSNAANNTVGSIDTISPGGDATYRYTLGCGPESTGRGISVKVEAFHLTVPDTQSVIHQVVVKAIPSLMVGNDG